MKVSVIAERLQHKWFPNTDDKAWKQWVNYKRRETRDLVELLKFDIRDSLKRRAIFLLLVPSDEFNFIYWTDGVGKFYHNTDFLKDLNTDLLSYATDLIVEFNTTLKPMHRDKPENFAQGGNGITVFWSVPDKYHSALYFYNSCILLLMTLLPEERCERIFKLFSLRDISTYSNMEDSSGYNPFQNLLHSNVDEKWKKQADTTIREIIIDEMTGKTKPREDWEDALKCYAYIIKLQLYGNDLPYSTELFADQIKFLVSKEHYGSDILFGWKIGRVLQILSDDKYKETRHQFARFVIFGNKSKFSVWDEKDLISAQTMIDEFGDEDKEIAKCIQSAIEDYEHRSTESNKKQIKAKNTEDLIMSQMK